MRTYFSTGPPLYFVVKDSNLDYSSAEIQNIFCGGQNCDRNSMVNQIAAFVATPNRYASSLTESYKLFHYLYFLCSYIDYPPASWIDDFKAWIRNEKCCFFTEDKKFCPHTSKEGCTECVEKGTDVTPDHFKKFIPFFLEDIPDDKCPKAGKALHGQVCF